MARLEKLEIQGFRSLRDVLWEPANLNLIIGENGTGKSNLCGSLKLAQESANRRLRGTVLSEGGLSQLLWDHRAPELAWCITLREERSSRLWRYTLALRPSGFAGGYRITRELLGDYTKVESGEEPEPFKLIERDYRGLRVWNPAQKKLVPLGSLSESSRYSNDRDASPIDQVGSDSLPARGNIPQDETALSALGWDGDTRRMLFLEFLSEPVIYQDLLVHKLANVRAAAVARFEQRLDSDGQNLAPFLHTLYENSRDFKRTLDGAMIAAFGGEFEELRFPPAADQKIQLCVRWKSLKDLISAASLSDGTLRFLMLIAALANPDPPPLIAIDEPETGLHPRMFPIIAELAAAAAEKSTIILTTHSPQFLDAFPDDCVPAVTVAELQEGATHLTRLDGDDLKRWLKDYSLGQMFVQGDLEALA